MSYIALQLLGAGGDGISESHLKSLHAQAEEGVMEFVREEPVTPSQEPCPETSSTTHSALLHYKAELRAAINSYRNNIVQLLMSCPTSALLPDLTNCYDKLWHISFPIINKLINKLSQTLLCTIRQTSVFLIAMYEHSKAAMGRLEKPRGDFPLWYQSNKTLESQ